MLTRREVTEWKQHPTTEKITSEILEAIDATAAAVLSGEVVADTAEKTAMNVARLTGRIEGLTMILEIEGEVDE